MDKRWKKKRNVKQKKQLIVQIVKASIRNSVAVSVVGSGPAFGCRQVFK
jgi:hypothetical protein